MSLPPHLHSCVLLASAGTGKTFQLSNRYLGLALQGIPVEQIVASTFTRKAAGEILASILGRLAVACGDDQQRRKLAQHLHVEGEWSQEQAVGLLRGLLRVLPQMQVSTLDGWFQRQVGAAALELGLPLGWRLAEQIDLDELHQQTVERTLVDRPCGQTLQLLTALQGGKPGRSVLGKVEEELEAAAGLWQACAGDSAAWELLAEVKPPEEDQIDAAVAAVRGYSLPINKNGKVNNLWKKARIKALHALESGHWPEVVEGGFLGKLLQGESSYSKHPIDADALRPVLDVVARKLLHELHQSTGAIRDLARHYSEILKELQDQSGLLSYDDFPRRLAACDQAERGRIARRLGASTRHLLLDEFQDTSVGQWQALQHSVEQALQAEQEDGSGSLFVVGDQKQSIYGFREGEPRLLDGLTQWFDLPSRPMSENFRSAQVILDAVNATFQELAQSFDPGESEILRRTLEGWSNFPTHRAAKSMHGVVRVVEVGGDGASTASANEKTVLQRVEDLYRRDPEKSIGVLVRKRKTASNLLAHLSARGVRACAAGGRPLVDSQAVDAALSLFQLADHPGDTASWFHLATSQLASFFDFDFRPGNPLRQDARRHSRTLRTRLLREGYGPLLENLHQNLRQTSAYDPWSLRRFEQLVELGHAWDTRSDLRPARFADLVREQNVADRDVGVVQVMTVHQAKGLDFDTVVLLLDASTRQHDTLFASRPDPRGPVTGVGRHPTAVQLQLARHLGCEAFLDAHCAQEVRELNEMLCLLYVGMTRAKTHLELVLPKPATNPSVNLDWIKPVDVVMTMLLAKDSPAPLPSEVDGAAWKVLWQTEALPHAVPATDLDPGDDAAATPEPSTPLFCEGEGHRSLPRWTPSSGTTDGKFQASTLFADRGSLARRRGTALHGLFEQVEWLEDFVHDDARQRELLQALDPTPSAQEVETWLQEFVHSTSLPGVREALCRPADLDPDIRLEVLRERPFAVRTRDPHGTLSILHGSYDRVVLQRRDQIVVAAEVLDFKTGSTTEEESLPETYRSQLKAYRRALCLQYDLQPQNVTCRLLYVDAGLIKES